MSDHEPDALSVTAGDASEPGRASFFFYLAVAIVFAVFFAFDLFEAISNLVLVPQVFTQNNDFYRENGLDGLVVSPPWVPLVVGVLLPPVAFLAAIVLARRRELWKFTLALVAALGLVAAVSLSLTAYVTTV
ncbi:hypothetical protein [Frigoribacterium sp. VKM Ac-2836]|uniref:hypothetical protein n=1 Tax=Frigoribacterium sp. VKM Ac-2836 TaxID=2739014 RepID=UPI001565B4D6|nr:hypothetical protein [Frigoribacterium sp. VKM Ac-2836]NRD25491.1 hypothetical protein [Frigoribacterium sp. VKM Ac-2836]